MDNKIFNRQNDTDPGKQIRLIAGLEPSKHAVTLLCGLHQETK